MPALRCRREAPPLAAAGSQEHIMSAQIDTWIAEHRNFDRLLDVMERELALFHRGEHPNYALMLDVMYYMTHYPDRYHHPAEDIVFARMGRHSADARALIGESHRQHRVVEQSGAALQEQLDAVVAGVMLPRAEVERPARLYIDYYRRHMRREEVALFPLAAATLAPADWRAIAQDIPRAADPLVGGAVGERYRLLQARIAAEVGCDCLTA
jgi:hemerythrin-like domain-containing protein